MNVTPFIDVLLVLIVVFMLLTNARMVMTTQVAHPGGDSRTTGIMLELTNDGRAPASR